MTNESNAVNHERKPGRHRFGRRTRFGIAAVSLVALGAVSAIAIDAGAHGRFWGYEHHRPMTVEQARERAVDKAEWILDATQATPEQRVEINGILADLVESLHPLVEQHRWNRRAFADALVGAEVDADALEALRLAEMELLDRASADAVEALARTSRVLTLEQRAELADRIGRFHRH